MPLTTWPTSPKRNAQSSVDDPEVGFQASLSPAFASPHTGLSRQHRSSRAPVTSLHLKLNQLSLTTMSKQLDQMISVTIVFPI
jgi:hypothetical protein